MPDNTDPNAINPVPVTPVIGQTSPATPEPPAAPLPAMDSEVPPPPMPGPAGGAGPTGDLQGLGIPPVITPQKAGGKVNRRMVATILGILVLVGGLGAGVVLVRQQQLFQQKAREVECVDNSECSFGYACIANKCVPVSTPTPKPPTPAPTPVTNPKNPTPACSTNSQCPTGQVCINGRCQTSTPECTTNADCTGGKVCIANSCQFECTTNADCGGGQVCVANKCQAGGGTGGGGAACKNANELNCDANGCTVGSNYSSGTPSCYVMKYHCNDVKGSGVSCDQLTGATLEGTGTSETFSADCGTEQIDINCGACGVIYPAQQKNPNGSNAFTSKRYASACSVTSAPAPGGESAQCLAVQAFDTNWTLLTSDQLSSLKAGDIVRFTIGATATTGVNDKAKFKINGVDRAEVTTKRPGTDEFYDEYTVPAGVTSFTVGAQMHNTVLGWF